MKDVMIATSNKGKVKEYREMLEPLGYAVHDLSEIEHGEVDENGTTFAQNAMIKAEAIYRSCDMITISDDSGLEITALNNEPGIHSARYLQGQPYSVKNRVLIERLEGKQDRSARFVCAIALIDDLGKHVFEGVMEGSIGFEPKGENGFGYDPIFIPANESRTSAEMSPEEKNAISHRGKATAKLLEYLRK